MNKVPLFTLHRINGKNFITVNEWTEEIDITAALIDEAQTDFIEQYANPNGMGYIKIKCANGEATYRPVSKPYEDVYHCELITSTYYDDFVIHTEPQPLPQPEFEGFPKIARLSRDVVVTEKIDGTNAQICITEDNQIFAGSRSKWITPGKNDNFGFAQWVQDNKEELLKLGPGKHFGEWYGLGIQRGYGLKEKRFALFNTHRWGNPEVRPKCCEVVTTLWTGAFDLMPLSLVMDNLKQYGSYHVPGFMRPEGVVIFHTAASVLLKKTFEKDEGKEN